MNQMVSKNKDKNNNNSSSNSLVFGLWPQIKRRFNQVVLTACHHMARYRFYNHWAKHPRVATVGFRRYSQTWP